MLRHTAIIAGFSILVLVSCPAAGADEQLAPLRLVVNLAEKGDVIVLLRPPDVLVKVADLERAGLINFTGQRETRAGEEYVALSSLAPALTYQLDEKEIALRLTAQPSMLPPTLMDMLRGPPADITYTSNSSFLLNYALTKRNRGALNFSGEAGLSIRQALLFTSLSRTERGFARGLSNLTIDDRKRLKRWVVGDTITGGGGLSIPQEILGVSLQRSFSLNPYFYRFPSLDIAANALTPSTLEVYVNNILVKREEVPPGPVELRNLPVIQGSGSARLVLRDAFGREQELIFPFYLASGLLARGLSEYNYSFGLVRQNFLGLNPHYGSAVFSANHQIGFTDKLTGGFFLQASRDFAVVGPSLATRLLGGELDLAGAASRAKGRSGGAVSVGYSRFARGIGVGGFARARSAAWPTLQTNLRQSLPRQEVQVFANFPLIPRVSPSLQYGAARFSDGGSNQRLQVLANLRISSRLGVVIAAERSRQPGGRSINGLFVSLNFILAPLTVATATVQTRDGQSSAGMEVRKSLPLGPGYGYAVETRVGQQQPVRGLVQYQNAFGRYEVGYDRTAGQNSQTVSVASAIVAVPGGLYLTRPVQQSFAVLRVPGLVGVRGYVNNQEMGRTNRRGDLVIPDLQPYYGNQISINAEGLPVNYSIEATERTIAPPFRAGALTLFSVNQIQAVTGKVVVVSGAETVVPAYGEISVAVGGKTSTSPLGAEGGFYFENLPAGRHPVKVEYATGVCEFELSVPPSRAPLFDLGAVRCVVP